MCARGVRWSRGWSEGNRALVIDPRRLLNPAIDDPAKDQHSPLIERRSAAAGERWQSGKRGKGADEANREHQDTEIARRALRGNDAVPLAPPRSHSGGGRIDFDVDRDVGRDIQRETRAERSAARHRLTAIPGGRHRKAQRSQSSGVGRNARRFEERDRKRARTARQSQRREAEGKLCRISLSAPSAISRPGRFWTGEHGVAGWALRPSASTAATTATPPAIKSTVSQGKWLSS